MNKRNLNCSWMLCGASLLAIGVSMPAVAQSNQGVETVVVTGQRAAIESAVKIKENADQIVDSIVADDAGKLPDRSITEVLQRVSGVVITRFNDLNNPDNYTVEGSGPTVRGLPGGGSTLNGREAFTANGGRQLLWGDVPSELMAAVDVFKTYTPDQLEGGMGGTINLRTHMPFDFDGFTAKGVVGTSYGDLIAQARPRASVMLSDRWNTKFGEMGLLVDVSYEDNSYRNDSIQIDQYYPHTTNTGETDGKTYYIPGGFDFHTTDIDHKRGGIYEAFQWKPTDKLEIYQTAFVSHSASKEYAYRFFDDSGVGSSLVPTSGGGGASAHKYDANGNLTYAEAFYYDVGSWYPGYSLCPDPNKQCSVGKTAATASKSETQTIDLSTGAIWTPTDDLRVTGALQFERSTSLQKSLELDTDVFLPPYSFDLRGTYPVVTTTHMDSFANTDNYLWDNTMDHKAKNDGQLMAANIDADYALHDGFWKSIKFGVRAAARQEEDRGSDWHWVGLTPWWNYWGSGLKYFTSTPNDVEYYAFPNYFRNAVHLPAGMLFAKRSLVESLDASYFHQHDTMGGDTTANVTFNPANISHSGTNNVGVYAMARFGMDNFYGTTVDGNIGIRLVYNDNHSDGYYAESSGQTYTDPSNGQTYSTNALSYANHGGKITWTPLPAFNVHFLLNNVHLEADDRIAVRVAGSQSMEQPGFGNMNASGTMWVHTNGGHITDFQVYGGVADLKPQLSRNLDISLEWYGAGGAAFHLSGFYKWIEDRMVYRDYTTHVDFDMGCQQNNSSICKGIVSEPTKISTLVNTDKESMIRGFEVGFTKYFDFLPERLRGFGAEANFTYIDSRAPGDTSYDMFGNLITGLPMTGLSRYSYNATLMYDRDPFSIRLSYNWRNRYLISGHGWNTSGSYSGSNTGVTCVENNYLVGGTGNNGDNGQCNYALPVWSKSFGSLDAGAEYKFDDHYSLSIQSQNLLNSTVKTTMGMGAREVGRSWFVADRRISVDLRVNY